MDVRDVWFGTSIGARFARGVLLPFSGLYWLGWNAYLAIYRLGIKRAAKPHRPIVVVGNFVVGGSGKSPATLACARVLKGSGRKVVVGCSGYGSPRSESATLAPAGPLGADEWGDEAAMIRMKLPEVPLVVGRDRVGAAEIVARELPGHVLLMDDGLQHLRLAPDVRIALDPPISNRWVMPAGPYREPRRSDRADQILPGKFDLVYEPLAFTTPDGRRMDAKEVSRRGPLGAITGIADPARFLADLHDAGLVPVVSIRLRDHDPMTAGTLLEPFEPGSTVLTTEKDWAKLSRRSDVGRVAFVIASREARIEPSAAFAAWLDESIQSILQT